ncbi:MAG: aldehyde dehydrogenase family protein [Pseudomonadota bacterium]|nr:aldehyde dehydrogenase family protein [Pseudomonadota bacterium]
MKLLHKMVAPAMVAAMMAVPAAGWADMVRHITVTGEGVVAATPDMATISLGVQHVADRVKAGNIYVNRNQIGAIVGSQPFGGEGLSGTGPKAGGPHYLARFAAVPTEEAGAWNGAMPADVAQAELDNANRESRQTQGTTISLPGPTGESNRLTTYAREPMLCMGPGAEAANKQAEIVRSLGGQAVVASGQLPEAALTTLQGFSGAMWWGNADQARAYDQALALRDGPILPLITGRPDAARVLGERHVCVDTTAAGGNAALLSGSS